MLNPTAVAMKAIFHLVIDHAQILPSVFDNTGHEELLRKKNEPSHILNAIIVNKNLKKIK